jgi:polyhydroxybutyrate depolymerase
MIMRRAVLGCALYVTGMTLASPGVAEQLVVDKSTRTYAIEKPAASGPQPTIIMLGARGTGAEVARSTKLGTLAPQQGFVAVFPDVPQPQWNFLPAKRSFWNFFRSAAADDGLFLKALVSDLVQRGIADRQRIYLAGESGGSVMALRMLCTDASLFAGLALLGPAMPEQTGPECRPSRPVPILLINGTKDEVYPFAGGPIAPEKTVSVWPNERLIGFLQQVNNHSGPPRTSSLPIKVPNTVAVDRWESCAGTMLTAYRVIDGPHAAPADLNAAQLMINFFVAPKQSNACVAALPGSGANPGQAPGTTPNRNTSAPGADPNSQSSTPGAAPGQNNTPNTAAGNPGGGGPGSGGPGASGSAPGAGAGPNASDPNSAGSTSTPSGASGSANAPGGAPGSMSAPSGAPGSMSAPGGAPGGTGGIGSPGDAGNPGTNTAGLGPPNDPGNPGTNTAGLGPPNDPGNPGTNTAGLGPPPDNANPGTQTGGLGPPPDNANPGTQTAGLGPPPNHTNPGTQTGGLGPPPHSPAGNPPLVSLPTPPILIPIPMAPPNVCKPQPPSMSGSGCNPTPRPGNMCHPKPPVGCDPPKTAAPAMPPHQGKPATPLVLRPNPSTTAAVSPPPSPGMIHLKPLPPSTFVPASVTPTGPAHDDALKKKKEAEKKQAEKKQAEKKQAEKKHAEKKQAERREAQRQAAQRQQYQDAMTTAATAAAIISIAGGMRRGGGGGGYSGGHRPMGGHASSPRRRH